MDLLANLSDYIESVTGTRSDMQALPDSAENVPLYLEQAYDLRMAHLFGHGIVLALAKEKSQIELPQLAKDWSNLSKALGADIALVLPRLESYERKRLVEKHIPFIVPRRQMFLPMFLVDLREYFPSIAKKPAKLGWVAQVILIRHLLCGDVINCPLSSIAAVLGYSKMAISQSVEQLKVLELCHTVPKGRTKSMQFEAPRHLLWERALPHLRSPVKRRYFIRGAGQPKKMWMRAGLSALADLTSLAPEAKETWAVDDQTVRKLLSEGRMTACPDMEEARWIVEGWAYRPDAVSASPDVDPYSLYLSLSGDRDERVQMALDSMMEQFP